MKPRLVFTAERPDEPAAPAPVVARGPLRHSAAARVFLRVLQLCALTGAGGRAHQLYAACVFLLTTTGAAFSVYWIVWRGLLLVETEGVVGAAARCGMFGLSEVLMWAPSVPCVCGGRRRYGAVLLTLERCLSPLVGRPGYRRPELSLRVQVNWLLAVAAGLTLFTAANSMQFLLGAYQGINFGPLSVSTAGVMGLAASFFAYATHFHLVSLKFVFAGAHVTTGFRFINQQLQTSIEGKAQLTPSALQELLALHDRLSHAFTSLTSSMYYELFIGMSYGTVSNISMWLLLILTIPSGTLWQHALMISQYVVGAGVAVVLPCELTQRALAAVGETRDLLLTAERRQPQLSQQLGLFRETVGRDLQTFGDLGLFRLRRSTLLSITATVLTYIIVMVQFYGAAGPEVVCAAGPANATEPVLH